ncbi:uncharacterized protein [Procambarus clarkii]|uniref:uncharacterized protein n=1 Tax=Procambarus clarkii TaxID=6728 RepID=UPI00374220F7
MCKMDILKFYGYILSDSEESVLQIDMLEENSSVDVEARLPTPPPPASNPRTPPISQVMVVPRAEVSSASAPCEAWSDSPVPDTPISPVHQPLSAVSPCSATSSSLFSKISSARTRTSPSSRSSHSSQVAPSSATSSTSSNDTPQLDKEMPVDETGNAGECACDNNWNKNETELSSVCSDDFNDAVSTHSASGTIDVETGLECKEPTSASMNSATNCSYTTTCEHEAETPSSSVTSSVPSSAPTRPPSPTASHTHKGSAYHKRPASRARASSKRRSTSRARSTSRKRSASRTRSLSRGRSSTKELPSSRSSREQLRPSSQVVSVSHV